MDETVAGLERWAARREEPVDAQGARVLLELAAGELGLKDLAELTPEVIEELFLQVFPDVVIAGADDAPGILAVGRSLAGYAAETAGVPAGRGAALLAALDDLTPEFTELLGDIDMAERETAAEVLAEMMTADGVDLGDDAAVQRWVEAFDALPERERFARTVGHLQQAEDLWVPPVRLAPPGELAAAARASGLTAAATGLAGWAGERALPEDGPAGADAAAAAAALGLDDPEEGGVRRIWYAALAAGLLVAEDDRVVPGPDLLTGADDETTCEIWFRLLDAAVSADADPAAGPVRAELPGVLLHLYERAEPVPRDELAEALLEHFAQEYDAPPAETVVAALDGELGTLAGWGVVGRAGNGDHLLTPLGVWGVRELLRADGFAAPVVGDLAGASAAELVEGLGRHHDDTADEEIDGWLATRDPAVAAADLIGVMRDGTPGARNLAAAVLHRVGAPAEPAVRAVPSGPPLGPYAALWLREHGYEVAEPDPGEMRWLFVDTLAGMLEVAEPGEAVAAVLADAPAGAELGGMIEDLWRVDHPEVVVVLAALGDHHPDRKVAKKARTAAFKARSVG
ncbi:hypothetical protein DPM19_21420 [Actinomadura craniellae]|uniref:Uncharacterized protein n=1 Tax=Actinomadura craniellae TaxID=2231787 RepID=A0A365H1T3_9ACTN|nr:hypothetical protein DPM19_21420 [Actinomadura craniellae]